LDEQCRPRNIDFQNFKCIVHIRNMNIPDIDIRDLLVFSMLMQHRSVTKVAATLNLPQPTVSRCVNRLREEFRDVLFVRTRSGMEPTSIALAAAPAVNDIIRIYGSQLSHPGKFDPKVSRREFALAASDVGHLLVLPRLFSEMASEAPRVKFTAVPLSQRPLIEELQSGEVDLAVGGFPNLFAGVLEQTLYQEEYVCLVRNDHPTVKHPMTLAQFKECEHIIVSTRTLGHIHQDIERRLLEICSPERVRIISHSFVVSALIVERTDLLLTVPSVVAQLLAQRASLRILPPPLPLPGFEVKQYWHERFHGDPGNQWLRHTIASLFRGYPIRARLSALRGPRSSAPPAKRPPA
jgi:DNA-binding transcriptional LysR family regulator